MTSVTAAIELLVGAVCVGLSWPCWQRGSVRFRITAGVLAVAGAVAIVNALVTLAEG